MSGQTLISHFPELLLPQRLRDISSLEIVWPLKLLQGPDSDLVPEEGHLDILLSILSANFPNLARLHLALKTSRLVGRRVDNQAILAPIDAFVRRHRSRLSQFTLSPSQSVFTPLLEDALDDIMAKLGVRQLPHLNAELWRNLDGSYVLVAVPTGNEPLVKKLASPYPKPPFGASVAGGGAVGDGYWIVRGDLNDDSSIYYCSMPR